MFYWHLKTEKKNHSAPYPRKKAFLKLSQHVNVIRISYLKGTVFPLIMAPGAKTNF